MEDSNNNLEKFFGTSSTKELNHKIGTFRTVKFGIV